MSVRSKRGPSRKALQRGSVLITIGIYGSGLLWACGSDDSGSGDGAAGSAGAAGASGSGGSSSGGSSGTGGASTGGTSSGGTSTGGTSTTADANTACNLNAPNDCTVCQAEKCCGQLTTCQADTDCNCMAECTGVSGLAGLSACRTSCGVTNDPADFAPLLECMNVGCPDADECTAPADAGPG